MDKNIFGHLLYTFNFLNNFYCTSLMQFYTPYKANNNEAVIIKQNMIYSIIRITAYEISFKK